MAKLTLTTSHPNTVSVVIWLCYLKWSPSGKPLCRASQFTHALHPTAIFSKGQILPAPSAPQTHVGILRFSTVLVLCPTGHECVGGGGWEI